MCGRFTLALLVVACGNGTLKISDDSSAPADTDEYAGPEPVIFTADAVCDGTPEWDFVLTVGDQQGDETVTGGIFIVYAEDGSVQDDGDYGCEAGTCTGSAVGGVCDVGEPMKFHFVVTDADGNESRAMGIIGRAKGQ